jgi:hypothetical protein
MSSKYVWAAGWLLQHTHIRLAGWLAGSYLCGGESEKKIETTNSDKILLSVFLVG